MDTSAPQKDLQTIVFEWFARRSPKIISLFHLFYYLWIASMAAVIYLQLINSNYFDLIYSSGKHLGQAALLLLGTAVLPGILGRFRVEIKVTRVITLFRRHIGITVFLFAFSHYLIVQFIPTLKGLISAQIPYQELFKNFGALALMIIFIMFLTSNNTSVKKLGPWWKKLHRFVYIALWLLVFHTGLQKISIWTLFIGAFATLEVLSWIYYFIAKNRQASPTN